MSAGVARGPRVSPCLTPSGSGRFVDRWKCFALIKSVSQKLGLTKTDLTVLEAHLSVLPKGPLDRGKLNMSYMSVTAVRERANCMNEKTFQRSEVRLEELGLIHRRLSPNGRRFPVVGPNRKIVSAFGIDMSPLLMRIEELEELRLQIVEEDRLIQAGMTRIRCLVQDFKLSLQAASKTVLDQAEALFKYVRNRLRRKISSLAEIDAIEHEIQFRFESITSAVQAPSPAPQPDQEVNSEGVEPISLPDAASDIQPVEDSQNDRHIESPRKEKNNTQALIYDAHRIQSVWQQSRSLSDLYPEFPRSERQMSRILFNFSSYIGIGPDLIGKAIATLGWEGLVRTLDYLAGRVHEIAKPQGYLKSMLKSYEEGHVIAGGKVRKPRSAGLPFVPEPVYP